MSTGARIRYIRKELGETQAIFAERFGVSLSALKAYELNDREPPSSFLVRLYSDLSIEPTWLLTGTGSKTSESRSENIVNAVIAIRTFATLKGIPIEPEREARLVLLIADYFDQGGAKDAPIVEKMMETVI